MERFTKEQIESLELSYQNFKNIINGGYDDDIEDFIKFVDDALDGLRNDLEGEE